MEHLENRIVTVLTELREEYEVKGLKTEFEGEGARIWEVLRLKDLARTAGLSVALKIGGCEAFMDMRLGKNMGVQEIIAPMTESAFAVRKFVGAARKVYTPEDLASRRLFINVETITGCGNFGEMLKMPEFEALYGLDIGRGDLTASLGKPELNQNSNEIFQLCTELCRELKNRYPQKHCNIGIGGPVNPESLKFLERMEEGLIDGFETKKVILDAKILRDGRAVDALQKVIEFEQLWVKYLNIEYENRIRESEGYSANMRRYAEELTAWKESASIATCYDAYPLSQKGETIRALGTGMVGSFLGTFFGMIVAIAACGPIARIALKLGPWEYFSLCFCAVSLIIALSGDNIFKGLAGAFFGMLLGMVGIAPIDASFRFTFGVYNLYGGINIIALMLGMFAIRMIAVNFARGEQKMPDMQSAKMHGLGIRLKDITNNLFNIFRSFWLGAVIGFLPGLGGNVSNLVAYGQAKKSSKHPEEFGKGCVDGIWASEVSNNSTIGGALIPMLTLGVPGDGQCAILLGALMLQGIETGPLLLTNEPVLTYTVFIGGMFAAVYVLVMQYLCMQVFPYMLRAPYHYLYGTIIFICLAGSFAVSNSVFNCGTTVVFGVISLLLCYMQIPISPTVLGFVIGPLLEQNLRKALTYSKTGPIEFITRPVSGFFLVLGVVLIITGTISYRKKKKAAAATGVEEEYNAEK